MISEKPIRPIKAVLNDRILAIDGLRAVAVLGVIIYHMLPSVLPGGFVGVDVFFCISGYVVCRSLLKESGNFFEYLVSFYARRVLRILPALLTVLLSVGFLSRLFIPHSYLSASSDETGFYAFFGLSNYELVRNADGYFTPRVEFNPYLHTWSLALEEQYYLIFPLLLYGTLGHKSRPIGRKPFGSLLQLVIPGLALISICICKYQSGYSTQFAYYLLPSRFWELATGAVLCMLIERKQCVLRSQLQASLCASIGVLLILGAMALTDMKQFPYPLALIPVLGTVFCIIAINTPYQEYAILKFLGLPLIVYVGKLSFSLYLWHWPVIVLIKWTIGLESWQSFCIAIALIASFGCLSYHLIESTFFRLRWILDNAFTVQIAHPGSNAGNLSRKGISLSANVVIVFIGVTCLAVGSYGFDRIAKSESLPQSVTMQRGRDPNPWKRELPFISYNRICRGETDRDWTGKTLFLIGDSHAGGYAEMANLLREEKGVSIYVHSRAGCAFGSLVRPSTEEDELWQKKLIALLKTHSKAGDCVLLASLRVLRLCDQFETHNLETVRTERNSSYRELDRQKAVEEGLVLLQQLKDLNLNVIIEAPKPVFRAPAFRCCDWFNRMNPIGRFGFEMEREFLIEHRESAMRSIEEVHRQLPDVQIWDPLPVLCPDKICSAFDGDKPLFFDGDHLTSHGNRKLYPSFLSKLESLWP